ncbi:hypothetical protein C8R44DRAFT_983593, partial [Mycena epipterygia]
ATAPPRPTLTSIRPNCTGANGYTQLFYACKSTSTAKQHSPRGKHQGKHDEKRRTYAHPREGVIPSRARPDCGGDAHFSCGRTRYDRVGLSWVRAGPYPINSWIDHEYVAPRTQPGERRGHADLPSHRRPEYRTLKSLAWLDCVVCVPADRATSRNESLRVLPLVPLTFRVAEKTDYIEGVLVPKGTVITVPVHPHSASARTASTCF